MAKISRPGGHKSIDDAKSAEERRTAMFAYLICFSERGGFLALRALDNIAGQSIILVR
jgi:hypothetical protein